MKTLVINGSPRGEGSNTMNLTKAFLEGTGWTDVEVIDISKLNIQGCKGCFGCWTTSPGKCVISDDMEALLPKFIEAKRIIWSFPLYCCYFPGQMKCLMDRMLPLALPEMITEAESGAHPARYEFSIEKQIYISTCGFWTAKGNYDSINALLNRDAGSPDEVFCEAGNRTETIFTGQGELFNIKEIKEYTDPYLDIVRRAGKECAEEGKISEETKKLLAEPIFPKEVYEEQANASW